MRTPIASGLAALFIAAPSLAGAQGYYGQGYGRYYSTPRGDYSRRDRDAGVYPEFRGIEQHIRQEIQTGLRDDLIEPDDARDLMAQLRTIQNRERREYAVHGWNLPEDDRESIRDQLNDLDNTVDRVRDEG